MSPRFTLPAPPVVSVWLAAAAATAAVGALLFLPAINKPAPPLSTHTQDLPYPTDALPGARDVSSPYGSIRVYEWGPDHGDRVLLVHGISTPSIALTDLAHRLVARGCRVMLFGRSFPCSQS
jgi:hypothetical protein